MKKRRPQREASPRWTEDDVSNIVCNPIYTGIPPYPQIVPEEQWISTAKKMIKEQGADWFLQTMLRTLRESMQQAEDLRTK